MNLFIFLHKPPSLPVILSEGKARVECMQPFFLYILQCSDDSYYVGHTDNLERRLSEHQEGVSCTYTASRLPVKLVYNELFASRDEAFHAERKLKKWARFKK